MKRFALLVLLVMASMTLSAQTVAIAPSTPVTKQVASLIDASTDYRSDLHNFYGPVAYRLVWIRNSQPSAQALAVINLFEHADSKGLNPNDYDGGRWQSRLSSLTSDAALAEFDVAMTASLMRYASHLSAGRIHPQTVDFAFETEKNVYLPNVVWQTANTADPAAFLAQSEPQSTEYKRLLTALASWRTIAADAANDTELPVVTKLSPKDTYDALPQLAAKLRTYGDLSSDIQIDGNRYEGAIVDAVKSFQRRNGLDADGVISKRTFAALNVAASRRVQQIELALERARWTPETVGPSITVNIPEFMLRARDEKGEELTMRVVVGKAAGHKTPVFNGDIKHVVFRPYWSVPPAIQRGEIVPKLEKDRAYLARNGYEVVDSNGRSLGSSVSDDTLRRLRSMQLQVRQKPGNSNALGLVKFLFPNENNVYLHDTPSQSTFALARRDASHGCIRLSDPAALATWTLRYQTATEWNAEKVQTAMKAEKNDQYVRLERPIPVMITYTTAVAQENGQVAFYDDIYGHDVQLTAALEQHSTRPAKTGAVLMAAK